MDIQHFKAFATVFKHKSLSKASEDLHLRQSTVGNHIRVLEEELDCKLFDRLSRKIVPTEEAGVLIGLASEIIERVEGIQGLFEGFKDMNRKIDV